MEASQSISAFNDNEIEQSVKDQLSEIIKQLNKAGLVVHILQNKAVIAKESENEVFTVTDGEDALRYVNSPRYADKILYVDEQKFYCHSHYLILRSDYFSVLFNGEFKENLMDAVNIELPLPGNFEPILRFLYSGILNENDALFDEQNIFHVIKTSDFLGIKELFTKAVSVFAHKWRVLTKSPMFRRSIIDYNFMDSVLDYGTKNALFKDGEKLKIVVLWDEEGNKNFTESKRLITAHKCLEEATVVDLEWGFKVNPNLFSSVDSLEFKGLVSRALNDLQRSRDDNRDCEDKCRRLSHCVKVLRSQLDEVSCNRCRTKIPRAAVKSRTCVTTQHSGTYKMNEGWSCCGELLKKSRGCKPLAISRHRVYSAT